jgi:hypothetical protein
MRRNLGEGLRPTYNFPSFYQHGLGPNTTQNTRFFIPSHEVTSIHKMLDPSLHKSF